MANDSNFDVNAINNSDYTMNSVVENNNLKAEGNGNGVADNNIDVNYSELGVNDIEISDQDFQDIINFMNDNAKRNRELSMKKCIENDTYFKRFYMRNKKTSYVNKNVRVLERLTRTQLLDLIDKCIHPQDVLRLTNIVKYKLK
nr:hypothetical protein TnSNPV_98 [Trichoplusia ni single nucleopolyhedrovirus]